MATTHFNWTTVFNTTENSVIHTFGKSVEMTVNFKTGTIQKFANDEKIYEGQMPENTSVKDYEAMLLGCAAAAEVIDSKTDKKE